MRPCPSVCLCVKHPMCPCAPVPLCLCAPLPLCDPATLCLCAPAPLRPCASVSNIHYVSVCGLVRARACERACMPLGPMDR